MKSILIDDKLHQKLKMYCVKNKLTMVEVITQAINGIVSGDIVYYGNGDAPLIKFDKVKLGKTEVVELPEDTQIKRTTYAPLGEPESEWPKTYMGKPLSGRKAVCPNCKQIVPVEFATEHHSDKHEGSQL